MSRQLMGIDEGMGWFHELLAGLVDDASGVIVGIEVDRGLRVEAMERLVLTNFLAVDGALANSTMRVMAGASHWFMWDRPKEFADLVHQFLEPTPLNH